MLGICYKSIVFISNTDEVHLVSTPTSSAFLLWLNWSGKHKSALYFIASVASTYRIVTEIVKQFLYLCHRHLMMPAKAIIFRAVHQLHSSIHSFICSSGQILLPLYLMYGLNNLSETYWDYSPAATDDQVRFWRSKVKVTAGCRGGKGIHVDAGASKYI